MAFWIRWKGADGGESAHVLGPFTSRRQASAARLKQVRAAADALEHGTGKRGVCTPDGALYRDDWDDAFLGRYVIEQDTPDTT